MTIWLRRVWHLLNRRRFERDLTAEMHAHRTEMPDDSTFGDTHRLLERSRDEWGWNWLDDLVQDVRVGCRTLIHAPAFALTSILILGVGIGLNVTLFQMAQVGILRPPRVQSPETLARLYRASPGSTSTAVPYPLAVFLRDGSTALSAVLIETSAAAGWGVDATEEVTVSQVSANWFAELGSHAQIGRVFAETIDDNPSAPPVAVLGYHFWQRRLGGEPSIVGTTILIDRRPFTVVGVTTASFPDLDMNVPDVYIPITQRRHLYPTSPLLESWTDNSVNLYGRFRPGLTRTALRESLRSAMQAAADYSPAVKRNEWLEPHLGTANFMDDEDRIGALMMLALLSSLTLLVLAVAAANLGNLVLSRTAGRVRELGMRAALGAGRGRIVRQLLAESLPLSVLGAVAGVGLSAAVVQAISNASELPAYLDFTPDLRTVVASLACAGVALATVGLLPAWQVARQDLMTAIKDGGHGVSRALDRAWVRRGLLAAQVAGSCLLLVVAGLMVRGIQRIAVADVGFEFERAAVLELPLDRAGVTGEAAVTLWRDIKSYIDGRADVDASAIALPAPLGGRVHQTHYRDTPALATLQQRVDPEYFEVMRIPVIAGRTFIANDEQVVIVSRRLAIEMFGTLDVLGRGFPRSQPTDVIVGIVGDAHTIRVHATTVAELYRPLRREDYAEAALVARSRDDAARLVPVLREAALVDPRLVPAVRLLRDEFDRQTRGPRIAAVIASAVGLSTLSLACLGIFGQWPPG